MKLIRCWTCHSYFTRLSGPALCQRITGDARRGIIYNLDFFPEYCRVPWRGDSDLDDAVPGGNRSLRNL